RLGFALQVGAHLDGAITEFRQAGLDRHGIELVGVDAHADAAGLHRIGWKLYDEGQFLVRPRPAHDDTRGDRGRIRFAARLMMNEADLLARTLAGLRNDAVESP